MTRSAVIIGLGGTGQWILTYLKKDLMELNNGKMPDNVRLLAIDTTAQTEAKKSIAWGDKEQADYEKADKRIGNLQLDPQTELIHIGGDCYPLAQEIAEGKHPHLNWFDVNYWMKEVALGRNNWILDNGAGRFRQFGLLAIYKDLLGGPVNSQILKKLPSAINDIKAKVPVGTSFELILVSSVAGGTGSAMLVPLGVLAKHMFGKDLVSTRAIVVLPSAFSPGKGSTELELRGGAALRELARAMMPPTGYSASMNFLPGSEYENVTYSRPFDGIHFVDGMRDGQPINTDPKYGVFPAVSGWVRQILDENSGDWYSRFVATNAKGATDYTRMAEGVFGVFGVKSYYAPMHSIKQTYRLKMADQVLKHIADPVEVVEDNMKFLQVNKQPAGAPPASFQAFTLLNQNVSFDGEQQNVTAFMAEIARIVQIGGENSAEEVGKKATAGWLGKRPEERVANSWLSPFTNLPATNEYAELRDKAKLEVEASFAKNFPASDKASPPREPGSQITYQLLTLNLENYLFAKHAGMGANGPEDYGTFGAMTREMMQAQVKIFKNTLRLQSAALLSDNKGHGRLGYTVSVLKALEGHFNEFIKFLAAVDQRRAQMAPQAKLGSDKDKNKNAWLMAYRTPPSLWEKLQSKPSDKAIRAEMSYLIACNDLVNYIREVTLHKSVEAAARQMLNFTVASRRELERWAAALLQGDPARDITGMISTVDQNINQVTAQINDDRRASQVEELIQWQSREAALSDEDKEWAFSGVSWKTGLGVGTGLNFQLAIAPEAVNGAELNAPSEDMSQQSRREVEKDNMNKMESVFEQKFGQRNQIISILDWCNAHKRPVDDFANELVDAIKPMTSLITGARPTMEAVSISVNKNSDKSGFAAELESAIRKKVTGSDAPSAQNPIEVIDSEDLYRLTAVCTQVGLKLDEFSYWGTCKATFERELDKTKKRSSGDPSMGNQIKFDENKRLLHALQSNFVQKEEKAAVELEVLLREDLQSIHILNPRIVSLLGETRKLKFVLQALALGWMVEVEDKSISGQCHWVLNVPRIKDVFWITENADKGAILDLDAIESLVLVGKDWNPDHQGIEMDWDTLSQKLMEARISAVEEEKSIFTQKIETALAAGGIVGAWKIRADKKMNAETRKYVIKFPAYDDLADYAERYYRSL